MGELYLDSGLWSETIPLFGRSAGLGGVSLNMGVGTVGPSGNSGKQILSTILTPLPRILRSDSAFGREEHCLTEDGQTVAHSDSISLVFLQFMRHSIALRACSFEVWNVPGSWEDL